MKKQIILWIASGLFFCSGCDIIKENDRLIPITGGSVSEKKVLLVDFTDQNCKNCLNATAEINNLESFFSDTIVVVSIHSNPLPYPLVTKEGNQYEQHFQAEDHPAGFIDGGINGKYVSHDPQVWGGFILERLKTEPDVNISMASAFDEIANEATINVKLTGNNVLTDVNLQLWLIENNITQWQLMLDGTINNDYIHNHVFRTSVNGTWGEPFSIEAGEEKDFNYACTLKTTWKPENCMIVGFVYRPDTDETINVQEISLINKE